MNNKKNSKNNQKFMETDISSHRRYKKELKPPLAQIPNMKPSSWINERLPEMLWAVLIIGNIERETALNFFRYIAKYVEKNHECFDITITGISKFSEAKKEEFIKYAISWSEEIKNALRPLALFPDLPAGEIWKKFLDQPIPKEDFQKLAEEVFKTYWHQSEEATDCRWIKFLCYIIAGKIKFSSSIDGIKETVRGVFEYPNYGDLRHIRPFIRAGEIGLRPNSKGEISNWSSSFWQYCFIKTGCIPEEAVNNKIKNRQKILSEEIEETRKHYFKETIDIRDKLIDHFFSTSNALPIDSRHEGSFGLALYGLLLFIEIIFYRASLSIMSRLALRSLVETYISFKYLLKKEEIEPSIWDEYRSYGTGQLKLLYLKLQELGQKIGSIDINELDYLVNEDKWIEFVPINLGHWDSVNLRKMSEDVGLKDLYDEYYNYTSGYIHANWGAVRESIYQKCANVLHRYHRIPIYDLPLLQSAIVDAKNITNNILECLSEAYPKFDFRLTKFVKKE